MRCKYIYKNNLVEEIKQCQRDAEPGSEYCFWHEQKDGKTFLRKG